ncbi:acyltransferase ChoActase/COT/CPT, partial [Ramicandelaber brevisporus]
MTYQTTLPPLPIPDLRDTFARYLESIEPVVNSSEELAKTRELVADFIKPGGEGERLQARLHEYAAAQPQKGNWLEQWWFSKAYHEWREPLVANSNHSMLFVDDPNTPKELINAWLPRGTFTKWQVRRAAHVVSRMMDYKNLLDTGRLPIDKFPDGSPMCMWQYTQQFGVSRVALPGCDKVIGDHPSTSTHAVVLVRDQVYRIELVDPTDGKTRMAAGDIEQQLWSVIDQVQALTELDPPVGCLTADNRDGWATARAHLLKIDPVNNANALETIDTAVLCIALDDYGAGPSPDVNYRVIFHGQSARNRWFDKPFVVIFTATGAGGNNGEHSPCDALIPLDVFNFALLEPAPPVDVPIPTTGLLAKLPPPQRIRFTVDDEILNSITAAQKTAMAITTDSDTAVGSLSARGNTDIKKLVKVAPDAFVQMAFQLAYYQLHGEFVGTYETASVRKYFHGRTETIRTLSNESKAFVLGMTDASLPADKKLALLRRACVKHSQRTKDAMFGRGIDRHMLGLPRKDTEYNPPSIHPVFTDPVFARSGTWRLSTSALPFSPRMGVTGFGSVVWDNKGYGINYFMGPKLIRFNAEGRKSG